ncbi:hypothetical protein [Lactobacillus mulieris]|uniref:Uncharacterized protein n=1 Tax=Lactobacillus mulieris TaxID=2508708 RepID=A0AAP3GV71_9LACO|nr:hypothetical protein [Lactobacillus mulieris]MCW8123438.1 hypothetical protein [Lactobacillus mulieris]MCZ3844149.1 hypothetical protein [Lactobacillus mulieris]MCZ3875809.1 hypothetical protein [Lactobacillus mulieris]MDK7326601.1 hypothetical protein [Lactobacillus mulieris]
MNIKEIFENSKFENETDFFKFMEKTDLMRVDRVSSFLGCGSQEGYLIHLDDFIIDTSTGLLYMPFKNGVLFIDKVKCLEFNKLMDDIRETLNDEEN